jgi:hypothetical protein
MTPAFHDWIERARATPIGAILQARQITLPGRGDRLAGPCPNCGGTDRFAVDLKKELFNCRGCEGKGHGAISFVMFLDNISFLQAVERITGEPPPAENDVLKQKRAKRKALGKLTETYDYYDELDVLLYQVCRYYPKDFSQRRPDLEHPDEWINNLDGVRLIPYRLAELIEAVARGITVFIVEGEKDVDNGVGLGLICTTTAMGLAGKGHWERGAYDEFFIGADVVLIPDQDKDPRKGRELARVIAKRLKPIAARVQLLNLPCKDLSDWIDAGGTREAFDDMPLDDVVETNGHDPTEAGSGFADVWEVPPAGEPPLPPIKYLHKRDFLMRFHPPEYLIDGMLQRRFVYAVSGQTGHAKTAIALYIAEQVASPDRNAMVGRHRAEKGRVVYFAGENPDDLCMRVIGADSKRTDDPLADRIWFIPGVFDIAQMYAALTTHVEQSGGVDLVIVDTSAAYFLGDEENSNAQMGAHARKLRRLTELPGGPCVLVLCHPTKSVLEPEQLLPRGGGAFLAEIDGNLTVWKHDENLIRLHHNKIRGPGFDPMTFQLEAITTPKLVDSKNRMLPTVRAVPISATAEEQQLDKAEDEERAVLAAYLRLGADRPSVADVALELDWKMGNGEPYKQRVLRVIDRLLKDRKPALLSKTRNDKYQLTEAGRTLARDYALHPRAAPPANNDGQDDLL